MNSEIYTLYLNQHNNSIRLPQSARGRALFTIDWFLNGSPRLRQHDNKRADALRQLAIQTDNSN